LSPAGHASVDETRVYFEAAFRAKTKLLHSARSHPFGDDVSLRDQTEDGFHPQGRPEIQYDARPAAREHVGAPMAEGRSSGSFDAQYVGAEISQCHAGMGAWTDAGDLDDPKPA
jgi:hypothetical protein